MASHLSRLVRIVALSAVLICGGSVLSSCGSNNKDGVASVGPIVTTTKTIAKGMSFSPEDLKDDNIPQDKIPSDAITSKEIATGHIAKHEIKAGQILLLNDMGMPPEADEHPEKIAPAGNTSAGDTAPDQASK